MILIKSFFRKKTTKIYLLLFSIVILGLIIVYSLINYYDITVNNYLKTNLTINFASSENYYNDLINNKQIENVKIGKIIKPDYSNKTLIKSSEEHILNDRIKGYESGTIYWDGFLIDESTTVLYSSKNFNIDLSSDELILAFPTETLNSKQRETANNILGKKLTFLSNNQKVEFTIKQIENIPISCIIISEEMYDKIDSSLNYYQITLADYKEATNVRKKILTLNYEEKYNVVKKSYEYSESQGMISIIDFLKKASLVGICLLFIILFIISNNILKDDRRNIYIERLVGFNKKDVSISMVVNMLLLITLSMIFAILSSILILSIINLIFNIKIIVFNFNMLFLIFIGIEIVSFIEMMIFSIQINKCLKKDYMKF